MDDFKLCNIKWGICDISKESVYGNNNDIICVEGDVNDDNEVRKNLPRLIGNISYVEGLKRICEKESCESNQREARINLDCLYLIHHRLTEAKRSLFDEIEDGLSRIRDLEERSNDRNSIDYWHNMKFYTYYYFLYRSHSHNYYWGNEESYYLLIEISRDNHFFEYASHYLVELLEKSIKAYEDRKSKKYRKFSVDFFKLFRYEFCSTEYELRRMYDLIGLSWRIIFTDSPEYDYNDNESFQSNLEKVNKLLSDFNEKTAKQECLLCYNMVNIYSEPNCINHILYSKISKFDLLWKNTNKDLRNTESKKKVNYQCYALMHVKNDSKYYFSICGLKAAEEVFIDRIKKYLPEIYVHAGMSGDIRYYYWSRNKCMYITYEKADNVSGLLEDKEKGMIKHMFSCCERKLLSKLKYDTKGKDVCMYIKFPPCYKCKIAIEVSGAIEINYSNEDRKDKSIKYRSDNDILAHKIRCLKM